MNWEEYVKKHTLSAEAAIGKIQSGNRVVLAHSAAEPPVLVAEMVKQAHRLLNVEVQHMVELSGAPYAQPQYEKNFRFNGIYASGGTRKALAAGRADFTPLFFHQLPHLYRRPDYPIDVALVTLSPPDATGRFSLGVAVDYTRQAALSAKTTIGVVNSNSPYIGGDALLSHTDIDVFVYDDTPLYPLPKPKVGEAEAGIGQILADFINDGDCLQLDIGALPDAVLAALFDKKDLGIHSEMFSDGVMRLHQAGVINGARKTLHPGKMVYSFAMGSPEFYQWMDKNPDIEGYPIDYVNDPRVVGRNDNLVSINSALSIDLLGQVAADSMGANGQFSGIGGQLDFVRGARFSQGGRTIIALPATAAGGKISRITSMLSHGQPVTTTRHDVDWVCTEYGLVSLYGKTNAQRAQALISLAAPQFREDLLRQARDVYGWRVS